MAQISVKNGLLSRFNLAYFAPPFCLAGVPAANENTKKENEK
jgi:hypothetical protein